MATHNYSSAPHKKTLLIIRLRKHKSRPKFSFRSYLKGRNTDRRNRNKKIAAIDEAYNFAKGCGGRLMIFT